MRLRFVVALPVFDNAETVTTVINDCLAICDYPIIIVDDGSRMEVEKLFLQKYSPHSRLHFIRHDKNQGKGAAILTATQFAVSRGWTHLITLDADGQHYPQDIPALSQAAQLNPWSLVIGDRQMKTQNVPQSSVIGRAISNFWIKYETDFKVSDTQSGFRIYPLFPMQMMKFYSRHYDFETEVLTRLMWKGIKVVSVPIQVKYFPPEKRVTHFHKFKDNFLLTIINIVLVGISLLKRNDSPVKSAFAVAVGVFVGCLPLYGLHTAIIILLALLLRLNFVYLFLGNQISIPPLIPLLILGAHFLSRQITGHAPHGFFGLSRDWMVGILSLSLALSLVAGIFVFCFKLYQRRPVNRISVKSGRGYGMMIMEYLLKKRGLPFVYFCLYFIVGFYFVFSLKARKASAEFSKILKVNPNFFTRQKLLWRQLYVFAQVLVDRAFQKISSEKQFVIHEKEDLSPFKMALQSDSGLIVLQTHFGGWEMSFNYFQHLNTLKNVSAVMHGSANEFTHSSLNKNTEKIGKLKVEFYNEQTNTGDRLLEALKNGNIVGMMGDRPVGRSYELVPLLGKLALIDTSAMRISLLCSVPIYSIFCVKKNTTDYTVSIVALVSQPDLPKEERLAQLSQNYASQVEKFVRNNPEQWFNFYPFWSETLFKTD